MSDFIPPSPSSLLFGLDVILDEEIDFIRVSGDKIVCNTQGLEWLKLAAPRGIQALKEIGEAIKNKHIAAATAIDNYEKYALKHLVTPPFNMGRLKGEE